MAAAIASTTVPVIGSRTAIAAVQLLERLHPQVLRPHRASWTHLAMLKGRVLS